MASLDLPLDRLVILVTTGSLGARTVNEAVLGLADRWSDRDDLAIRHVIGRRDFADTTPPTTHGLAYQAVEYETQMADALTAADVAVTRSGGGVAELAALGVPAVLVPLPIAPHDHQRANAEALVAAGGAVLLDDADCDADRLAIELEPLIEDRSRLAAMAEAQRAVARPGAAQAVAGLVLEVANGH